MKGDRTDVDMNALYRDSEDPWDYLNVSRHGLTLTICQSAWTSESRSLAEWGCAEGILLKTLTEGLAPRPQEVYGCELNSIAAGRAARRLNIPIEVADLTEVVIEDSFDLIVISDVLPYTPGKETWIIENALRALSPSGALVLTSWDVNPEEHVPSLRDCIPEGVNYEYYLTAEKCEYAVIRRS